MNLGMGSVQFIVYLKRTEIKTEGQDNYLNYFKIRYLHYKFISRDTCRFNILIILVSTTQFCSQLSKSQSLRVCNSEIQCWQLEILIGEKCQLISLY